MKTVQFDRSDEPAAQAEGEDDVALEPGVVPLTEPAEGVPPVVDTPEELARVGIAC